MNTILSCSGARVKPSYSPRGDFAWPEWSPDGKAIAYVTRRNDEPFLAILNLDSGGHIDVVPGNFPVWSPDGRSILLTRDNESVVAVDLDCATRSSVAGISVSVRYP